ncbi:MAG: alpha/beta hydrolase [Treponema sp.]|jgi:acetyl esterase/lipase|nr:alpha/beta hydrolase [Treponema sp.]
MPVVKRKSSVLMFCILVTFGITISACKPADLHHDTGIESENAEHGVSGKLTFSYRILEIRVKLSGYKQIYAKGVEALVLTTQKMNSSKPQVPPKNFYRRFIVTETTIKGRPCFLITPKQNIRTDTVVFFMYGGGFMLGIDFWHWNTIERILVELSMPVCVPLYPIFPETDYNITMNFINEAFNQFCSAYPDSRIVGLGDSSGSYLLLALCHYLTLTDAQRFPDRLVCVSPAQLVGIDEATFNEIKKIDEKDIVIPIEIFKDLRFLFDLHDDDLNWFSAPLQGDFSRFPPITVFSGTHDLFYPLMKSFVENVRSQGKNIDLYTGYGMMHVWPYMPNTSESTQALNIILGIIQNGGTQG